MSSFWAKRFAFMTIAGAALLLAWHVPARAYAPCDPQRLIMLRDRLAEDVKAIQSTQAQLDELVDKNAEYFLTYGTTKADYDRDIKRKKQELADSREIEAKDRSELQYCGAERNLPQTPRAGKPLPGIQSTPVPQLDVSKMTGSGTHYFEFADTKDGSLAMNAPANYAWAHMMGTAGTPPHTLALLSCPTLLSSQGARYEFDCNFSVSLWEPGKINVFGALKNSAQWRAKATFIFGDKHTSTLSVHSDGGPMFDATSKTTRRAPAVNWRMHETTP